MEWTRKQRYRPLTEISSTELAELQSTVDQCEWRQTFHIQPNTGLLNDPNGFSYFNGEYHLFYQWFPLGPVHGLKYWYHLKSKDLVHWDDLGVGLTPDNEFDSHGAYSGSAIEHQGKLYLLYTGNTRDANWVRHPYQCVAIMDDNYQITKLDKPVIPSVPLGYTDHFRDPKVWKQDDRYYAIIGAQRLNQTGCIVLYSSTNLLDWTFTGEIETEMDPFGFMWECPDYFELEDQGVVIFSPQGLAASGDHYQNIYQSGYVIGEKLDMQQNKLRHGDFQELDRGFDFYAPQTTVDSSGRRILVGWMGLPEITYPTDSNGWAHCLTLPRELSIQDGYLLQQPVKELAALRQQVHIVKDTIANETKVYEGFTGTSYEMICEINSIDAKTVGIEFRTSEQEKTTVYYDTTDKKVVLDRTYSGQDVGVDYGTIRQCTLETTSIKIQLFVDVSSVEIFINDGIEVFTSRIFPRKNSDGIRFFASEGSAEFQMSKWDY
ncbi:sucrose-6-phosphate hydrolase [Sporosarcina sp. YIM B06819]|uniref:glycoside hydrolase family 32 protein n=1 Tax=Sporosarcina sp. YIM B06819 TaxID=3081769 RepID=UPI00298BDEEE|nr:sucrose-6-phosphate hydrolase [Sporosarcina sp. YIM B06819]